jgi:hypothetical protein
MSAPNNNPAWKSSSLLREPLLWFFAVAALLFALSTWWKNTRPPLAEVTPEWLETVERDFERRSKRAPNPEERVKLAYQLLEEEILCQEAIRAGHLENPQIKNLLAVIQREQFQPVLADPTDEQLRAYREKNPEAYQFPAEIGFEHVSFANAAGVPPGVLDQLRAGQAVAGDPSLKLPNPLPMTWLPQLEKLFGKDFTNRLAECPQGEWTGPLTSARGVHFVKITARNAPREMSFEEVKPALASQWLKDRLAEAVSAKVAEARRNYRVKLPAGVPEP